MRGIRKLLLLILLVLLMIDNLLLPSKGLQLMGD